MYRFVTVKGSCGSPYDIEACEQNANKMVREGYELFQVYQSTTPGCGGSGQSVLVMIFRKADRS